MSLSGLVMQLIVSYFATKATWPNSKRKRKEGSMEKWVHNYYRKGGRQPQSAKVVNRTSPSIFFTLSTHSLNMLLSSISRACSFCLLKFIFFLYIISCIILFISYFFIQIHAVFPFHN